MERLENPPGFMRSEAQRELDLVTVAEKYLQGWYQIEIARHLSQIRDYVVSTDMVSRDVAELRQRWKQSQLFDFNEAKARELDRVDTLERECWIGYRKSWETEKVTMVETIELKSMPGKKGKTIKLPVRDRRRIVESRKQSAGEYLRMVGWCINKRCELLGLNAPFRIDTGQPEVAGTGLPETATSESRLATIMQAALKRKEEAQRALDNPAEGTM